MTRRSTSRSSCCGWALEAKQKRSQLRATEHLFCEELVVADPKELGESIFKSTQVYAGRSGICESWRGSLASRWTRPT